MLITVSEEDSHPTVRSTSSQSAMKSSEFLIRHFFFCFTKRYVRCPWDFWSHFKKYTFIKPVKVCLFFEGNKYSETFYACQDIVCVCTDRQTEVTYFLDDSVTFPEIYFPAPRLTFQTVSVAILLSLCEWLSPLSVTGGDRARWRRQHATLPCS